MNWHPRQKALLFQPDTYDSALLLSSQMLTDDLTASPSGDLGVACERFQEALGTHSTDIVIKHPRTRRQNIHIKSIDYYHSKCLFSNSYKSLSISHLLGFLHYRVTVICIMNL